MARQQDLDPYVCVVSGLKALTTCCSLCIICVLGLISSFQVGSAGSHPLLPSLLVDWLVGEGGGANDKLLASRVAHVVIAVWYCMHWGKCDPGKKLKSCFFQGSSIDTSAAESVAQNAKPQRVGIEGPLLEVDAILSRLASSVSTDLMPGEGDPATLFMPQQPLHPCVLPQVLDGGIGIPGAMTLPTLRAGWGECGPCIKS